MGNNKELKTADYTRRAIEKYRANKEQTTITMQQGTREKIANKYGNISLNKYINALIDKDLQSSDKIIIK